MAEKTIDEFPQAAPLDGTETFLTQQVDGAGRKTKKATAEDVRTFAQSGLGTAALSDATDFATAGQGALADTAVQPGSLPAFGSAASANIGDFATALQGQKADTAVQPGDLPALGNLAAKDKAAIADIDASGAPNSSTYLRGDGAWAPVSGGGGGDMLAATYDPRTVNGDAFLMDNMTEGTSAKIMTDAERSKLSGIEAGAQVNAVASVNGKTGAVSLGAGDVSARPDSWVPAWGDVTSKPSTFPPSAHSHTIGDVTGLQSALEGKAATGHTHAWGDITGKPDVIAAGATQQAAREAIGAITEAQMQSYTDQVKQVTQAQYDALSPPDPGTVYVVVG